MNYNTFINAVSCQALAIVVVEQCGGWDGFESIAEQVATHGADKGWPNFTMYADTVQFGEGNRDLILCHAADLAGDLGSGSTGELLASFPCMQGLSAPEIEQTLFCGRHEDDKIIVFNALAWFALEEVSREYGRLVEDAGFMEDMERDEV